MAAPASQPALPPAWVVFAITFIAYLALARLGLMLAGPPGHASPLFPAAGVGLAAAFAWGRTALAAVAAAAFAANLWHLDANTSFAAIVLLTSLGTAGGAALQALVGARLVRRFVTQPLLLSEPADLARFMLMVVPLACLTSASIAVPMLLAGRAIGADAALPTWAARWAGDTLGMLIAAPVVWAFIAQPRDAWAPRRWSVALPLALGTAVMALGILAPMRAEEAAVQHAFFWPLALVSLASVSMLGALLLTITARAPRRIDTGVIDRSRAVEQRSGDMEAEATQRQRIAAALRESQQRLRNLLDHAPIGVAYTTAEGRIREANPYLRELLGTTSERLKDMPFTHLLQGEDRASVGEACARLLAGETPMARAQVRLVAADGRLVAARASISVLRGGRDGDPRRMVWIIEDVGDHLALAEAQRARESAELANRAKSEFLSRMSHELRTPLNALLGFTQLLELDRRQPLAPHQLEWTAQMRRAGWHLLHMINDTLDLSRIEAGHVELETRTLDLQELVDAAQALVQQSAARRRVQIEAHLGTGATAVLGDATRVKQILTNLLSNAVKYNVEGGSVIVSSRLGGEGRVALDVIDTGAGLSAEQLAHLFQPFNRLGQEAGPIEGTGIGLVISLRLAELMGGTLQARSSLGMGSTFTLELPRAAVAPAPPRAADEDSIGPALYRRRVIHYVEDNETNAEVMRGILALRPQVELEVSALGLDGLAAIKRRRPSLVLLDMQLPDIDGLEMLRHLQASADTADIPVIVVSADATETRISQAIATGATHYLTKPVNVGQFLSAVDSVLDQLDTHFG